MKSNSKTSDMIYLSSVVLLLSHSVVPDFDSFYYFSTLVAFSSIIVGMGENCATFYSGIFCLSDNVVEPIPGYAVMDPMDT